MFLFVVFLLESNNCKRKFIGRSENVGRRSVRRTEATEAASNCLRFRGRHLASNPIARRWRRCHVTHRRPMQMSSPCVPRITLLTGKRQMAPSIRTRPQIVIAFPLFTYSCLVSALNNEKQWPPLPSPPPAPPAPAPAPLIRRSTHVLLPLLTPTALHILSVYPCIYAAVCLSLFLNVCLSVAECSESFVTLLGRSGGGDDPVSSSSSSSSSLFL